MKVSVLKSKNPYLNLAFEEYLLKHCEDEYFLLWQNEPTVVIGKNQNVFAEVNISYVKEKGIKIARRITGGGAVYHDLGNLNYSFISKKSEEGIDFKRFATPIIEALEEMGLTPVLSGRNDILISGQKISGNAQTVFGNRVLHHGTLLFNSDTEVLSSVLTVDPEKLKAKAISSTKSRIANIKDFLSFDCTVLDFSNSIKKHIVGKYNAAEINIEKNDIIQSLAVRNSLEEWIFPSGDFLSSFTLSQKERYDFGSVALKIELKKNLIHNFKISGDFFSLKEIADLESKFIGIPLTEISNKVSSVNISDYISGMSNEQFILLINKE